MEEYAIANGEHCGVVFEVDHLEISHKRETVNALFEQFQWKDHKWELSNWHFTSLKIMRFKMEVGTKI